MLVENTPSTVLVEGVSFSQTTLESACTDERNVDSLCWIRRIWSLNIGIEIPDFRKCGEKSEPAEHRPSFDNKTAGRESAKPGSGQHNSVFPRTSEFSKRKYAANSGIPDHTALFVQRNRRLRR